MLWVTFPFPIPGLLSMATGHRWQISVRELSLPTVSPSPFPGLMSDLTPPSGRAPSWLIHTVGLLWWYAGSGSRAFPFHRMSCLCVWRALLALQLHPTHRLTACPLLGDWSNPKLVDPYGWTPMVVRWQRFSRLPLPPFVLSVRVACLVGSLAAPHPPTDRVSPLWRLLLLPFGVVSSLPTLLGICLCCSTTPSLSLLPLALSGAWRQSSPG
jgi:hypothetical protein